jgi:deoxyhypusine synthase
MATYTVEIDGDRLNERGINRLMDYLMDEDMAAVINDAVVDALGKLPAEMRDAIEVKVR